jgi:hypothetical protein
MSHDLKIGFDHELGGQAIKNDDGSYILFKDGHIIINAVKEIFLNTLTPEEPEEMVIASLSL